MYIYIYATESTERPNAYLQAPTWRTCALTPLKRGTSTQLQVFGPDILVRFSRSLLAQNTPQECAVNIPLTLTTSFGIVIGCNLRCNRKFRKTCLLKVEFSSLFRNLEVQALAANKTKLCTFYTNSKVLRETQLVCTTAFLEQPSENFAAPSGHGPNNDPDQRKSTNVCFSAN